MFWLKAQGEHKKSLQLCNICMQQLFIGYHTYVRSTCRTEEGAS